jgi:hypothetical protein
MAVAATSTWTPKKPMWLRVTVVASAAALALYVFLAWQSPWQPGRFWGLTYGSIAAAFFVNAGLYPLRRRLRAWPLGTVQRWLQLHIYGSVAATLLVLMHMGFRWPAGTMGWWLFGLTLWTTATGILGVLLQKWIPPRISRNLHVEAIFERVPELIDRLSTEAATLMAGSGETLARVYQQDIQPLLAAPRPVWATLFDLRGGRVRAIEPLTRIETFVEEADRDRLRSLTAIVHEKLDLDAHLSLQRALRLWLYGHIPPAMLLLGLLIVHVLAVVIH